MKKSNVFGIVFLIFITFFISTQFFSIASNSGNSGSMFAFSVYENMDKGNCSINGYDSCEYTNYEYGKSETMTKIAYNDNRNEYGFYESAYTDIDYICEGDSATFVILDKAGNDFDCTKAGCEGQSIDKEGNLKVSNNEIFVNANENGYAYLYVICFDYDQYFKETDDGITIETQEDWNWIYQYRFFAVNKNDFIMNEIIIDTIDEEPIIDIVQETQPIIEKGNFFDNVKDFVVNLLNKIKEIFN